MYPNISTNDRQTEALAGLLGPEHPDPAVLCDRIRTYEHTLSELKAHLHTTFASVGGLDALPLSEPTRTMLGLSKAPSPRSGARVLSAQAAPAMQRSLSASAPPTTHHLTSLTHLDLPGIRTQPPWAGQFALLHPAHSQTTPVSAGYVGDIEATLVPRRANNGPATPTTADTDDPIDTLTAAELADASHGRLVALVGGLQQMICEQRLDIEDLEATLRERKALVQSLRLQLRDKELRQFTAASDSAGLRRTASIMAVPGSERAMPQAQVVNLETATRVFSSTAAMSRISSGSSMHDGNGDVHAGSAVSSSVDNARRPSGYVNGWPVYGSNNGAALDTPTTKSRASLPTTDTEPGMTNGGVARYGASPLAPPRLPQMDPPQATHSFRSIPHRIFHRSSTVSGLGDNIPRSAGPGSSATCTSRRRFRVIIKNAPRQLYSRLSSRLRKTDH
ncbi:hypothetical protein GGF46_001759 [Coemansia sp. RSA 552]|nr:hypothetical protein GGF46_001759 [Coemansia sp. RSA 552]